MSQHLSLFQPQSASAANIAPRYYAGDDELERVLQRRGVRHGYLLARAGKPDSYLRKWAPKTAVDFEVGRLLASELAAEFGVAPAWPSPATYDRVLSALREWRTAHPGQKITPGSPS